MEPILVAIIFVSFFCTFLALPYWIRKAKEYGYVGQDVHKVKKEDVAEGGGISVLFGISVGVLLFIGFSTFYFNNLTNTVEIFALLCVLYIASLVGIIDDLLGWKEGLSKRMRFLIVFFAAIPLMVINAGEASITLPFLGVVNLGLIYPLIIIPFGIMGATTAFNILAGYNGLESGQGIILLAALSIVTYLTGETWLTIICLIAVASLLAFYIFNMHPAKIFPGDILTYSTGALIAGVTILGNIERIAIFFFIPYILEVILKLRGKLQKESFAKVQEDGSLVLRYKKVYGLEHVALKLLQKIKPSKKVYEKEVVFLIHAFQIIIIILGFLLFPIQ